MLHGSGCSQVNFQLCVMQPSKPCQICCQLILTLAWCILLDWGITKIYKLEQHSLRYVSGACILWWPWYFHFWNSCFLYIDIITDIFLFMCYLFQEGYFFSVWYIKKIWNWFSNILKIFLQVLTKILQQGTEFDTLAETVLADRYEQLVQLVTMIGDKGELPIAMALASVVVTPQMVRLDMCMLLYLFFCCCCFD